MKRNKTPAVAVLIVFPVVLLSGCSCDALKSSLYETLHNISDMKNEDVPEQDRQIHEGYDVYKQKRDEYLKGPGDSLEIPPD